MAGEKRTPPRGRDKDWDKNRPDFQMGGIGESPEPQDIPEENAAPKRDRTAPDQL